MKLFLFLLSFSFCSLSLGQNNGFETGDFDPNEPMDTLEGAYILEEGANPEIEVYIPDIFSPNGDGVNDYFQIKASTDHNLVITRFYIFDRWGYKVFERFNLSIHSSDGWWDGMLKRFTLNTGVFAYYIELQYPGGLRKTFKGNVTLVR